VCGLCIAFALERVLDERASMNREHLAATADFGVLRADETQELA
jgi:hypothetical protein